MPFTFSHPAVFVPLVRFLKQRVSVTGLVAGSMIPDLEYFIRMKGMSRYGHAWAGVLWFDLPLALLTASLFHTFLRNALLLQMPSFVRRRCQFVLSFNWNRWLLQNLMLIVFSVIAGSCSHLLWDSFVHEGAKLLEGFFEHYTRESEEDDFLIYYLFFGLNSIAGLLVLRSYFWQLPAAVLAVPRPAGFPFWTVVSMTAIAVFFLRVLISDDLPFLSYVDSIISSFLLAVITTVFVQRFVHGQARLYATGGRAKRS